MASDNTESDGPGPTGSPSDNTQSPGGPRAATADPPPPPPGLEGVLTRYAGELATATMLDADTLRACTSRVRGYLAWLDQTADR